MNSEGRRIPWQRRPWKPGLCSDCHRPPTKPAKYLRRGLCLACYNYRKRKGLKLPPKIDLRSVMQRKARGGEQRILRRPWD